MAVVKVVEPPVKGAEAVVETPAAPDLAAELAAVKAQAAEAAAKLAEREAADKKAREKALADQGKHKELLTQREQELADAQAKLKVHEEREAVRVAGVEKANAAALKTLPDEIKALAPANLDADGMADWLSKAAVLAKDAETRPAGGIVRGRAPSGEPHPDAVKYAAERGLDPVLVHNSMVRTKRLPAGVVLIPVA